MPLPTLPKPHRRSRNRSKRNKNIPFNAAAGTITSVTHGTLLTTVVFAQNMDVRCTAIPANWTMEDSQITSITWTNATTAVLHSPQNTTAGSDYRFGGTNVIRTSLGGPVAAKAGVMA